MVNACVTEASLLIQFDIRPRLLISSKLSQNSGIISSKIFTSYRTRKFSNPTSDKLYRNFSKHVEN